MSETSPTISENPPVATDDAKIDSSQAAVPGGATQAAESGAVGVHPAHFPEMTTESGQGAELPLARFLDVTLSASVELGRALIPIGEVLKLGEGAVLELDREVTEPVDIMVQGVRLARGEVVIVDNCYAVRITEVETGQMGRVGPSGSSSNAGSSQN